MIYVKFGWDLLRDSGEFFNFFFICFNLQKTLSGYNIYIVYFRQYLTKTIQAKSDEVNRNLAFKACFVSGMIEFGQQGSREIFYQL